ncbi:hypothetical protein ACNKHV_10690 [Shigella flexneri]
MAQYYEFLRLGREGYTKVQNASYQVAAYLADESPNSGRMSSSVRVARTKASRRFASN